MTREQQAWARVTGAAATVADLYTAGNCTPVAYRELFESTVDVVFVGLSMMDVAEAMCAGCSGLDNAEALDNVEAYLDRQAFIDELELQGAFAALKAND